MSRVQLTAKLEEKPQLDPKLEQQLRAKFQLIQRAHRNLKAAEAEEDRLKAELGAMREEEGVEKLGIDGFNVTLRCDTYEVLDEKKFIALGGDLAIYRQALVRKPKKQYELVTYPKEKA